MKIQYVLVIFAVATRAYGKQSVLLEETSFLDKCIP